MVDNIEEFFRLYATAMDQAAADEMTSFSKNPMVFVSDDKKQVCSSLKAVHQFNTKLLLALQNGGVTRHEPTINQSMRLSDTVRFVNVRWSLYDKDSQLLFSCYCSFTLQLNKHKKLKIIVAVLDDDQKIISKLLQQLEDK
ncbi:hypothetical protein [Aliiglaciecola sp. LCG003]|uniref:hypothetical protein n=1 Tax=Aliiglaciecola sp. LCG003 TaxID=3053655 RepID=UPI00257420C8|nr:hypothetical protein [Aliiglaciecola sp. LCG003]WJG10382.1 hypothetical protein QR722_04915 [Aliiglaciecola sp. LCG003]